jgi:hypothetical protein
MEEAGSGHEDSSHNILTLVPCRFCLRSQVTPGLSMSIRIRPICKVYIHTHTTVCRALRCASTVHAAVVLRYQQ